MEAQVVRFSRPLLIETSHYQDDSPFFQTVYGFRIICVVSTVLFQMEMTSSPSAMMRGVSLTGRTRKGLYIQSKITG